MTTAEPNWIEKFMEYNKDAEDVGALSDGDHSYKELYYHRMVLFAVICDQNPFNAWKSWIHDDGTGLEGYFIVGLETREGHFSYHFEAKYWDMFDVTELDRAPKYDGHTSDDVTRLLSL